MAEQAHIFPISKMSEVLGVSRSGYYRWLSRGPSTRTRQNQRLREAIVRVWKDSKKKYGSPRIHRQLLTEGWQVSRVRIARLMAEMGIASRIRRKWIKTTHSKHSWPVAPNLLDRRFTPEQLGKVWVSDITYLSGGNGWLYLTTVMDLGDRQILGWSLSEGMSAEQTSLAALREAVAKRESTPGLLFHSDQGSQYACASFTELLAGHKITQSMSRKGNCWDNAPAESFFKTLKYELDMPDRYCSYAQLRSAIFEYIEIWYNRKRLHSGIGYLTPVQAEQKLKQKQAA